MAMEHTSFIDDFSIQPTLLGDFPLTLDTVDFQRILLLLGIYISLG
jgi:hypothetical protein